jgi:putative ABC transport system permease protein
VRGLLPIAFRNLLRAKRRTLLTGGTMVLGSAALVLGSGLSDGIARQLTGSLVAVQTGQLQVVVRAVDFVPQNSPFDAYGQDQIPMAGALAKAIEDEGREAGVTKAVPYLSGRVTALAGSRSSPGTLVGIDPARDVEIRGAFPAEAGSFLPEGDPSAVYVAAPVARKLRLAPGDTVSFVVQTSQGAVNSLDATVCGIFRKGAPWYDATFYVPLPAAQSLYDWKDGATNIKIGLNESGTAAARRKRPAIEAIVARAGKPPSASGVRVRVEAFDEAGRFAFSIIQANQTALLILSSFLFAAAAVGIVNSLLMSVHERTREIGTVRALGMRRGMVVRLIVLEGLALGIVCALLGVALGGGLVLYWGSRGIPMNTMTLAWMAGGDRLFTVLDPGSVLRAVVSITTLSTLAALYPAHAASRLEIREALQHV